MGPTPPGNASIFTGFRPSLSAAAARPIRHWQSLQFSTRKALGVWRRARRVPHPPEQGADRRPQPRRRSNVSLCSLRDGNSLENFSDEDMGLNGVVTLRWHERN